MMRSKHILGPSLITNESRLLRCLRSPRFYAFVYLNGALLTLLNPSPTIAAAPWHTIFAIWAMGSTLFIPIYLGWQLVLLRLWIRPGHIEVPEIIVMGLTLLILTPIFLGFAAVLDVKVTNPTEVVVIFVFALIMLQGTSYVYIRFADRLLFPDVYASTPSQTQPDARPMFVQGTTLPLHHVETITARGRYSEVATRNETQIARIRFGDLVADLPVDCGFQIHRSIWVSRALANNTVRDGRRTYIDIPPGRRLPVAREREREFENWLECIDDMKKQYGANLRRTP